MKESDCIDAYKCGLSKKCIGCKDYMCGNPKPDGIFDAKKKLYLLLLRADPSTVSDDNIEMMRTLSNDEEIQKYLSESLKTKGDI